MSLYIQQLFQLVSIANVVLSWTLGTTGILWDIVQWDTNSRIVKGVKARRCSHFRPNSQSGQEMAAAPNLPPPESRGR